MSRIIVHAHGGASVGHPAIRLAQNARDLGFDDKAFLDKSLTMYLAEKLYPRISLTRGDLPKECDV